jgi:lysosomal acid lipase/cholesteryl ester hydrolase
MDTTSEEFFDYSFEQMADFDLPATIDLVLEKTGHKKVSFIGH